MTALSFSQPPSLLTAAEAPNASSKPSDAFFRDLQMSVHLFLPLSRRSGSLPPPQLPRRVLRASARRGSLFVALPDVSARLTFPTKSHPRLTKFHVRRPAETPSSASLPPSWTHQPPDSILSTAWYPGASAYDPSMFCFTVGVKDHPVHLLDATDPSRVCLLFLFPGTIALTTPSILADTSKLPHH
jgi:hypothetical protein